jgi:hypothetical protein
VCTSTIQTHDPVRTSAGEVDAFAAADDEIGTVAMTARKIERLDAVS